MSRFNSLLIVFSFENDNISKCILVKLLYYILIELTAEF